MGADYKNFIGKQVDIKSSEVRFRIKGVLVAVYGDVLVIQGLTCWGVCDKDILDFQVINQQLTFEVFEVINEEMDFEEKRAVV